MTIETAPTTRLATPGALLFVVGVVLMWWGAGVFRKGEVGSNGDDVPVVNPRSLLTPGFGGGSSDAGDGASGSF